jgi:hypothetical protein
MSSFFRVPICVFLRTILFVTVFYLFDLIGQARADVIQEGHRMARLQTFFSRRQPCGKEDYGRSGYINDER